MAGLKTKTRHPSFNGRLDGPENQVWERKTLDKTPEKEYV